jgi:hypothetical protein
MSNLYLGYTLYDLDPAWTCTSKVPSDAASLALLNCEASLKDQAKKIFEHEEDDD